MLMLIAEARNLERSYPHALRGTAEGILELIITKPSSSFLGFAVRPFWAPLTYPTNIGALIITYNINWGLLIRIIA